MTILKYALKSDVNKVPLPRGAAILHAGIDPEGIDSVALWAAVEPDAELEVREFLAVVTGEELPKDNILSFISTIVVGKLVWHIFELQGQHESKPTYQTEILSSHKWTS